MKQKLSNYIAEKLLASGITDVFMITGGGAMHLDDALGHQEGLHCLYNHHEQACAIAAEAYARIHNKIGALCVTTGPGGTNAITGVVGGVCPHPQQDCGSVRDDGTWRHQCDERRCGRISGFNPDVCHFRTGAL